MGILANVLGMFLEIVENTNFTEVLYFIDS